MEQRNINITYNTTKRYRSSEAKRSKVWVSGGSLDGIVGSNSTGSKDVRFECCVCLCARRSLVLRSYNKRVCVTQCDQLKQYQPSSSKVGR